MQPNPLSSALAAIAGQFELFKQKSSGLDVFRDKERKIRDLIARHQRSLERLEKQRAKAAKTVDEANPYSYARYLQPLADAVLEHFPGMAARIMGPYGLGNTASISIYDPAKGDTDGVVGWLQFRYESNDGQLSYVDLDKHSGRYPPNSLGDINGLNYEAVPLTAETTMDELVQLFRRGAGGV
ncbi:hypothetical protein [Methylibium petroleiphilum]|uniref:Uncharacterized protein n=1 Tax=Methylibium petroleiphilum (strain ATCC BAA-1232 / LMG 22953 / PM1) TaxID=420662 RepID=A2SN04_METPP|nr:hypothetical protein [Methylibium petroleiphilum]ABM96943.1 hypothetical protein Mpe_B0165 [Methylibium petroleiphilum PM1]